MSTPTTDRTEQDQVFALADRFFEAISAGDMQTVREIYAPDATIWHNFHPTDATREENVQLLTAVTSAWTNLRFESVRRQATDYGFVQQHIIRGEGPDGTPFEAPAILLVTVRDAYVARIEEYFDPAQVPMPSTS